MPTDRRQDRTKNQTAELKPGEEYPALQLRYVYVELNAPLPAIDEASASVTPPTGPAIETSLDYTTLMQEAPFGIGNPSSRAIRRNPLNPRRSNTREERRKRSGRSPV